MGKHTHGSPSLIIVLSNYKRLNNDAIIISSSSFERIESLASDTDTDTHSESESAIFYLASLAFCFLFCARCVFWFRIVLFFCRAQHEIKCAVNYAILCFVRFAFFPIHHGNGQRIAGKCEESSQKEGRTGDSNKF